jgi:hypothetical protein
MLPARRITGSSPDEVDLFFHLPNPSSRNMTLGFTQPLTEMSTCDLSGDKRRPARKADDLTAICEPIIYRKCGSLNISQPYGPPVWLKSDILHISGNYRSIDLHGRVFDQLVDETNWGFLSIELDSNIFELKSAAIMYGQFSRWKSCTALQYN